MAPKVKFTREQIIENSLEVARNKGIDAVTAREVAVQLKTSPRPIFTWFDTMEELKLEVYYLAKKRYKKTIEEGLRDKHPYLGVCRQSVMFAKREPELYKLIFLEKPAEITDGPMKVLDYLQGLVRESVVQDFGFGDEMADNYFRNLYLTAYALSMIAVTDDCPYSDEEIDSILNGVSASAHNIR